MKINRPSFSQTTPDEKNEDGPNEPKNDTFIDYQISCDEQNKNFELINKELEADFNKIPHIDELKNEMDLLKMAAKTTESISDKLIKLYDKKFPKKCNTCGKVFLTRNDYLKETYTYRSKTNTIFAKDQVQEFRNCICNSTLVVLTNDRRDSSFFGKIRRRLFDACVAKIMALTNQPENNVRILVRNIFRKIIKESQEQISLSNPCPKKISQELNEQTQSWLRKIKSLKK